MNPCARVFVLSFLSCIATAAHSADERASQFFRQYCFQCHDERESEADVRLDLLSPKIDANNVELWKDVVHNLQRGEMPPEDETQPDAKVRQAFLNQVMPALARFEDDQNPADKHLQRLTNTQIANSLKSLLYTTIDIAPYLVEDPASKHGYSLQSEFQFSGGYFNLYLPKLEEVVASVVPDMIAKPKPPEQFAFRNNEWEKQHYLAPRDGIKASGKRYYQGPNWLEDKFKIPLPPRHEFRLRITDNRMEGTFRIRVKLRNMPPTEGGKITPQELSVFLCNGRLRTHGPTVGVVNVPAKEGLQTLDFFGNLRDWPGVSDKKIYPEIELDRQKASFRTLTLQANGTLTGFKLPGQLRGENKSSPVPNRAAESFLIRADDFWRPIVKDRRARNKLAKSAAIWGPFTDTAAAARKEIYKPPIYKDAIKTHGWLQIESVEFEVPFIESWPPKITQDFMHDGALQPEKMAGQLKAFARKAWRRPLTAEMETYLEAMMQKQLEAFPDNPHLSLKDALITVLADPKFLHMTSTGGSVQEKNHELVSRLAFFLWDGPPDDALFEVASQDTPITDAQLKEQVDRLLADAKAARFAENLAALWFDFKRFDQIAIDPVYFPDWPLTMKKQFKDEAIALFRELLKEDLSCLNLVDADFVMVNRVLAHHYGIEAVDHYGFKRVPAPEGRGGALGMGVFHQALSDGRQSHAINRGVWIRSRLLGDPVGEPPANVPALSDQKSDVPMSLKERLKLHTRGACYDCHKDVDHWGLATEDFSPIGTFRTHVRRPSKLVRGSGLVVRRGEATDSAVEIDGTAISNTEALKKYILAHHKDNFAYGFTKHLFSYALGRKPSWRDEEILLELQKHFQDNDYTMRELIKAIVTSNHFTKRKS